MQVINPCVWFRESGFSHYQPQFKLFSLWSSTYFFFFFNWRGGYERLVICHHEIEAYRLKLLLSIICLLLSEPRHVISMGPHQQEVPGEASVLHAAPLPASLQCQSVAKTEGAWAALAALGCMCQMYRLVHRDVPSVFVCIGMSAGACDWHIPNVPTKNYWHTRDNVAVVVVILATIPDILATFLFVNE